MRRDEGMVALTGLRLVLATRQVVIRCISSPLKDKAQWERFGRTARLNRGPSDLERGRRWHPPPAVGTDIAARRRTAFEAGRVQPNEVVTYMVFYGLAALVALLIVGATLALQRGKRRSSPGMSNGEQFNITTHNQSGGTNIRVVTSPEPIEGYTMQRRTP